jgi:hypothetical protein
LDENQYWQVKDADQERAREKTYPQSNQLVIGRWLFFLCGDEFALNLI